MRIVTDDRVATFCAERLGVLFTPPFRCIGIERAGDIVGGVVFNFPQACSVHASVAGTGWTKAFLAECGRMAFGALGARRVTIVTEQPHVVRLAERLGGEIEARMRNHFGEGRDGVVVGILKREYRFDPQGLGEPRPIGGSHRFRPELP